MPPVDPSNGCLSNVPDTEQLAASVGGLGRENSDFCLIFGIPSWLTPLRDHSGRSTFEVRWNLSHSQVHTQRLHSNEAGSQVLLMRFGFIGSRPLHLVPLSSFPLHTLLFPLFFHVLLSSCLVISSFSSFARALVPALVCTCTSTYILT